MAIPKKIHYCWMGGNPKPESVLKCINSWKKYCPDYEIIEWNESNIDVTMNTYTKQAYESKAWGFVPDYLRLWIIYHHGGIYLDTDVQIIRSFDSLLDKGGFAGFEDDEHIALGLGFGAEPKNQIIAKQMEVYENLQFINADGTLNRTPSPTYSTNVMKEFGIVANTGVPQCVDNFWCYPPEYFCPKSFKTGMMKLTKNTYSIHQFDASWYSDEEQKMKQKYWRDAQIDYWIHLPNRVLMKLLGASNYEKLKKVLKNEKK